MYIIKKCKLFECYDIDGEFIYIHLIIGLAI